MRRSGPKTIQRSAGSTFGSSLPLKTKAPKKFQFFLFVVYYTCQTSATRSEKVHVIYRCQCSFSCRWLSIAMPASIWKTCDLSHQLEHVLLWRRAVKCSLDLASCESTKPRNCFYSDHFQILISSWRQLLKLCRQKGKDEPHVLRFPVLIGLIITSTRSDLVAVKSRELLLHKSKESQL